MPWNLALSSALLARSVRTTRYGIRVASMASIADVVGSIGSALRLGRLGVVRPVVPVLGIGKGAHQAPQEAVELLAFRLGQHGRDHLLSPRLGTDGLVPRRVAG